MLSRWVSGVELQGDLATYVRVWLHAKSILFIRMILSVGEEKGCSFGQYVIKKKIENDTKSHFLYRYSHAIA